MSACAAEPILKVNSGNKDVKAGVIAVVDGKYVVYRVNDGSGPIYFVVKNDGSINTQWSENCGEDCVRTVTSTSLGN
jgi:hypothetical protein